MCGLDGLASGNLENSLSGSAGLLVQYKGSLKYVRQDKLLFVIWTSKLQLTQLVSSHVKIMFQGRLPGSGWLAVFLFCFCFMLHQK